MTGAVLGAVWGLIGSRPAHDASVHYHIMSEPLLLVRQALSLHATWPASILQALTSLNVLAFGVITSCKGPGLGFMHIYCQEVLNPVLAVHPVHNFCYKTENGMLLAQKVGHQCL